MQYCHPIFPDFEDEIQQFAIIRQFMRNLHLLVHDYQDNIRGFQDVMDGIAHQEVIDLDEEDEGVPNEGAEANVEEDAQNMASQ